MNISPYEFNQSIKNTVETIPLSSCHELLRDLAVENKVLYIIIFMLLSYILYQLFKKN